MQHLEDLNMTGQSISNQISTEDQEKEENDRRQLMQTTVTAKAGIENVTSSKSTFPGLENQISKTTVLQAILNQYKTLPLVGIEYIIELFDSSGKEPTYTCVLCDKRNDPRTVIAHLTSYNHRIAYLNKHFPTVSRAFVNLPRTLKGAAYKRGVNQISVQVCKAIEETFGRLQLQQVDKDLFEQNRIQFIKIVNQVNHFRETPESTFMDAFDSRWVTDFNAMVAEFTLKEQKEKEELQRIEDLKKENLRKKQEDKRISKSKTRNPDFKSRRREAREKVDKPKRAHNGDRSSSLSSISSSSSSSSSSRSRSHTPDPKKSKSQTRLPKVWDRKYKDEVKRCEETLEKDLKFHKKYPEKHPDYPEEWKRFWNRRSKELQAEGKDTTDYDFKPEWIEFWNERMIDLHNEELDDRKEEIMKKVKSEMASELRRNRSPVRKLRTWDCDRGRNRERDHYGRSKYRRSPTTKYSTPYSFSNRRSSSSPPVKEEVIENLEVIGLLRLLTALERQLDSLGPKIVALLSKALAAEKNKPNSAEELLFDEEVCILLETVKEKLKGQLLAGVIDKVAIGATKSVIQNTARLLHNATESKKKKDKLDQKMKKQQELLEKSRPSRLEIEALSLRAKESVTVEKKSEPVSVPGVGAVDKVAIAQQIAVALLALGKTNISNEELETLTNAVVGMAKASKNTDKPVTAADFVKSLTGETSSNNIKTDTTTTTVTSATDPVTAADTLPTTTATDTHTTSANILTTTTSSYPTDTLTTSSSSYPTDTFTTSSSCYPTDTFTTGSNSHPVHTFTTSSISRPTETFTASSNSPVQTVSTSSNSRPTDTFTASSNFHPVNNFTTSSNSRPVNTFTTDSSSHPVNTFTNSSSSHPVNTFTTRSSSHSVNTFTTSSSSQSVNNFTTSSVSRPIRTFTASPKIHPVKTFTTSSNSHPVNTFTTSFDSRPTDTFTTSSNCRPTDTFTTRASSYHTDTFTTSSSSYPTDTFTTGSSSYPIDDYKSTTHTNTVLTTSTISSSTSSSDSSSSSSSSHDSEDDSSRAGSVEKDVPASYSKKSEKTKDFDLKKQLQNFASLSAKEQHGLISFLKNLEATDLAKVEKLRAYVNVEPSSPPPPPAPKYPIIPLDDFSVQPETRKSPAPPPPAPAPKVPIISLDDFPVPTQTWRSVSPFSARQGTHNPCDKPKPQIKVISSFSWKPKVDIFAPKLDMFAEPDDEEQEEAQEKEKEKEKPKSQYNSKWDLSDDDDDYSFEDIYKAADRKVKENEEAKKRTFSSRSRSKSPRSWTRSRSRSPAYKKHPFDS